MKEDIQKLEEHASRLESFLLKTSQQRAEFIELFSKIEPVLEQVAEQETMQEVRAVMDDMLKQV